MKITGFLLMPSGWVIVLAALALLPMNTARVIFTLVGLAVEMLGFIFVVRAHLGPRSDHK